MGTTMPRKRRRSYKKTSPYKRLIVIIPCVVLLVVLAVFGVSRYLTMKTYQEYPLSYKELIVRTASEYNLQPWHVAAVIKIGRAHV